MSRPCLLTAVSTDAVSFVPDHSSRCISQYPSAPPAEPLHFTVSSGAARLSPVLLAVSRPCVLTAVSTDAVSFIRKVLAAV